MVNFAKLTEPQLNLIKRCSAGKPIDYTITLFLHTHIGKTVEVKGIDILSLTLGTQFAECFSPNISVELSLAAGSAITLLMNRKYLRASLKIVLNKEGVADSSQIVNGNYSCVIRNTEDPILQFGNIDTADLTGDEFNHKKVMVVLELEDDKIYEQYKTSASMVLRNVTMSEALLAVASTFGFDTAFIQKPDYDIKYPCITLAPSKTIVECVKHLQTSSAYRGIYTSGYMLYTDHGILYIAPRAQMSDDRKIISFINMGEGIPRMLESYSYITDNHATIMVVDPITKIDMRTRLIEQASCIQCVDPVMIWDHVPKVSGEKIEVAPVNTIIFPSGIEDVSIKAKGMTFKSELTRNFCEVTRRLSANSLEQYHMVWRNAIPFFIRPNSNIKIVNSRKEAIEELEGVPSSVVYMFTAQPGLNQTRFTCDAAVIVTVP